MKDWRNQGHTERRIEIAMIGDALPEIPSPYLLQSRFSRRTQRGDNLNGSFRARLRAGELLIGTMITIPSPEIAELLAQTGFDWLFIDAEHGVFEAQQMQAVLQGAGSAAPCIIRLSSTEDTVVKKALDVGAAGIIAPQVNTAEIAERVVRSAKFSPEGSRGLGISRANHYGMQFDEYTRTANENTAVIVQAEHIKAVENMESIVRVSGVDAVFVGPFDLSASMGRPGEVGHPEVAEAIDHVRDVCLAGGVRIGIFGVSAEAVKPFIAQGYTLIVAGADTMLLGHAAGALLDGLRRDDHDS